MTMCDRSDGKRAEHRVESTVEEADGSTTIETEALCEDHMLALVQSDSTAHGVGTL